MGSRRQAEVVGFWDFQVLYLSLATIALLIGYAWGVFTAAVDAGFDKGRRGSEVTLLKAVFGLFSNGLR